MTKVIQCTHWTFTIVLPYNNGAKLITLDFIFECLFWIPYTNIHDNTHMPNPISCTLFKATTFQFALDNNLIWCFEWSCYWVHALHSFIITIKTSFTCIQEGIYKKGVFCTIGVTIKGFWVTSTITYTKWTNQESYQNITTFLSRGHWYLVWEQTMNPIQIEPSLK